ncbi:MAG: glycerol-3-phosphate dehydrogenase/oxidase [Myxococcales bacterium]|nr:glycerol-3-phosphate dehydrogenase/oxidase [Myxococcales bacterium]
MSAVNARPWSRLESESFDIVVIGGGVIGAAAARVAAKRGLSVAVVEANDIASGTSSRSSKLIHGGFRYLEQGDLSLVFESVSERQVLMKIAPHLVRPLGFMFPIYEGHPVRLSVLRLGLFVYEGLALFRSPKLHRTLSSEEILEDFPGLESDGLKGGPLFWDCATDDARITLENAIDASESGAAILTHARVTSLLRTDGRVTGVGVVDALQPERRMEVSAGVVINATGPWSDAVRSMGGTPSQQLRLTKGVHLVIPAHKLGIRHTIAAFHPTDRRVLFMIPWGDQIYVGTTDTDYDGDPAEARTTRADVSYLLEAVRAYFPSVQIDDDDISATWAGLRSLIRTEGLAPSQVSREHVITEDDDGLISIAGGKLTTHRRMGEEVVDHAVKRLRASGREITENRGTDTANLPLPGAVGWPEGDDGTEVSRQVAEAAGGRLTDETCTYLANRYGTRALELVRSLRDEVATMPLVPGRPEIMGQVDYAVQHEFAATVTDFMARRTQLFFRAPDQGLGAIGAVTERMAGMLGWSEEEARRHADEYRREVERSRRWRED